MMIFYIVTHPGLTREEKCCLEKLYIKHCKLFMYIAAEIAEGMADDVI